MPTFLSYDHLQWPAMLVTLAAAWLVASSRVGRRKFGFWVFALSNVLWILWGWHAQAHALIVLQVCLFALNLRGIKKHEPLGTTIHSNGINESALPRS